MIQKSRPAPRERRQKIAIGERRWPEVRSLVVMMLIPKMAYATKQARCPINTFLSFIMYA